MKRSTAAIASVLFLVVLANIGHYLPAAALTQAEEQQNEEIKQQERQHQDQEIQKNMDSLLQQLPVLVARQIQHSLG
ncbi:MAG: hypothetical protein KGI33_11590 [Thaumarchaeota archaeon]|nr:hypothetical protein [Nitrososphaerota archaeon]